MENHDSHTPNHPAHDGQRQYAAWKGAAIMIGVIVGFYVLREHWGHALGYAPYLILLACPLMHIFMHGGHGQHHGHDEKDQAK